MRRSSTGFVVVVLMALATVAAACGGDDGETASPSTSASASTTPTTSPTVSTVVGADCPNPEGGDLNTCLGDIAAGVYETMTFVPHLTYEVPEGWSNMEDLPGNFLLLPPGSTLAGVNPETSDFLGVYSSVGAPLQCTSDESADSSVAAAPEAIVAWLRTQPAIAVGPATEVTIGGLSGLQVDLSFDDSHADVACHDDLGAFAMVFVGTGSSLLAHGVSPDYVLRLALLTNGDKVLAVELADAPNGGSDLGDWWTAAAEVVASLAFD